MQALHLTKGPTKNDVTPLGRSRRVNDFLEGEEENKIKILLISFMDNTLKTN